MKPDPESEPEEKSDADGMSDLGDRLRDVIADGVTMLERRLAQLSKGQANQKKADEIADLIKGAATAMSHVRRFDEARRAATRKLTPAIVISYLRELPPERRLTILAEVGDFGDGEGANGSVLS